MDKQLQKKVIVGQASIWAATMIVNAIVLVILDNWEGRFKFGEKYFEATPPSVSYRFSTFV